jgi:hypothetical protein
MYLYSFLRTKFNCASSQNKRSKTNLVQQASALLHQECILSSVWRIRRMRHILLGERLPFQAGALSGFGGLKTVVTDELAFPAMPMCCHQGH